MPQDAARLLRIARRLNEVERGSPEADAAIHYVLGLASRLSRYRGWVIARFGLNAALTF